MTTFFRYTESEEFSSGPLGLGQEPWCTATALWCTLPAQHSPQGGLCLSGYLTISLQIPESRISYLGILPAILFHYNGQISSPHFTPQLSTDMNNGLLICWIHCSPMIQHVQKRTCLHPLSPTTFPPFYLLSHSWHHYSVTQARNLEVILSRLLFPSIFMTSNSSWTYLLNILWNFNTTSALIQAWSFLTWRTRTPDHLSESPVFLLCNHPPHS